MNIYQVTREEMISINMLFGGFVFRQITDGKHFVKLSKGQERTIQHWLAVQLIPTGLK